jgi:hypothetical protein
MAVGIGEILQNGIVFDVKNWGTTVETEELFEAVEALFSTLESRQIEYLLAGGIAMLSYVEGRNTQDIDFIFSADALSSLPELVIIEENRDFARGLFGSLKVDLWLTKNRLFKYVNQKYAVEKQFGGRTIRCVTVEGLLILKFYALPSLYRQGRFDRVSLYENDITQLLLHYSVSLEPILKLLKQYVLESDLEAIQETTADILRRIRRFQTQQKNLGQELEA